MTGLNARLWCVHLSIFALLACLTLPAVALTESDMNALAGECEELANAGDYAAAGECSQKLMQAAMDAMPEQMRQMMEASADHNIDFDNTSMAADAEQLLQQSQAAQQRSADERAAERKDRKAEQAARDAAYEKHQRALKCAKFNGRSAGAGDAQHSYGFTSNCDQPVSVYLCFADGPDRPSQTREKRLQPGGTVQWKFAKQTKYTPLTVYDACFQEQQCGPQPSAIACRES